MNHIKTLLFGAASLLAVQSANAVAAYPGLLTMQQPDGTTVEIQIVGDEFGSAVLTEDGYLLKQEGRGYYYADLDNNGNTVSSGILATAPSARSAKANEFLRGVDMQGRVFPALERIHAANRSMSATYGDMPQAVFAKAGPGLFPKSKFPTTGKIKALVILVEFPDQPFTLGDAAHDYFTRLLTEPGFSDYDATGSAADWFRDNSCGQFDPQFDVYGPVMLPNEMAYYGGHDGNRSDIRPQRMITDACAILDPEVDFSQYDNDHDGYVDNVFVFYSGLSEAAGGTADTIWPHSWDISTPEPEGKYIHDGVQLEHYACSNEWHYKENLPDGIGTFVHEFSHVMGLPDLYATKSQFSYYYTPNEWDTLDRGNYNNNSRTPPCYSAFERYALGWLEPMEVTKAMDIRLNPISDSNTALRISTVGNPLEFFLLENRQKKGWDTYLPGHGMLAWHIDYESGVWTNNVVNDNQDHQRVDIEEANNMRSVSTRGGVPFPGTENVTEFTDYTRPSMLAWNNTPTGKPVTDIAESEDGIITLKVMGGGKVFDAPQVKVTDIHHEGFTASWAPDNNATMYEVSVYAVRNSQRIYADGYNRRNAGCTSSIEVTGLEPQTEYYVEVRNANLYAESEPSDPVKVKTLKAEFVNFCPVVTEETDIESHKFTANWNEMADAVDYRVNVYTKTKGEPVVELCDVANGLTDLPAGWTTSATAVYNQTSYSGAAVPALRFSADGRFIESPRFTKDISGLSFWSRGVNAKGKGTLKVFGLVNGEWVELDSYIPSDDKGGSTYELHADLIPEGVRAIRVALACNEACNVSVDDIKVLWGGDEQIVMLPAFTDAAAGGATSLKVTNLNHLTTYYYTVAGVNAAGQVSRASKEKAITTPDGPDSIENIDTAAGNFRVSVSGNRLMFFDAEGPVTVTTPAGASFTTNSNEATVVRGIYIVSNGAKAVKVIVR